ncbi:FAD-dependent oxidoreductase [Nioella sediminis]|jgi:3-hydroxyacyl-CoA dehydrogenase|uniref:FAD-dependent oxidoreductase n=1 Tax=Nioella sediminis TaxID=1912092 RepID=UPI0008FD8646|nr:FAD-dependent oxidoreductase [Nioella sediminis]
MTADMPVTVRKDGDIAWVTIDSPPVNATSQAVRAGLESAVEAVKGARLAVLKCAGKTFIAGGDMSEFDGPALLPHLPDVVQMIEDSGVPFLALLHGSVLGGGFEIAMGCAWRFAAPGTKFGLPEVNVGIIPGAGGTQRAPRLVGMEAAIEMACNGRMYSATDMLALGGIDRIVDDPDAAARAFAADLPERPVAVSARSCAALSDAEYAAKAAEIAKRAKGQQSPLLNLESLQWAALPFAEGQPMERARHLEMRAGAESRALRHAFFAERQVMKPKAIAGATPRDLSHVAVVGGGLMGAGIAASCLSAGLRVTLIERSAEEASAAQGRVEGLVAGALKRGKISQSQYESQMTAFAAVDNYAAASGVDLAIEAVFEDLGVKQAVFAELAKHLSRDAILATNTSYLDPREIFADIPNKARCLGLHFFSPAHVMKLVEVVNTPETDPDVLATGFQLAKRLRKIAVLSGICDGFIGNRMLSAYRREAEYLLADGALPHEIDAAMRGFGMPMGPFELQDLTGLQIAWANRKRQAETRDPAERYERIADTLCEMGRLGQRSGKGWYAYSEGSRAPERDAEVEALIVAYSADRGITRRTYTEQDIRDRLLTVYANEGARIVEEGIAEDFAAVDIVKLHGYGFPRWRGGPMHYAAQVGWAAMARVMAEVAGESPGSWVMAEHLARALEGEQT